MITLTQVADTKIQALLEQEGKLGKAGLRIRVVGGGCSGLQYQMYFDETREDGDVLVQGSGFAVYLDPETVRLMKGAVVDFEEGESGSGFRIDNPNAAHSCGCGDSFCE